MIIVQRRVLAVLKTRKQSFQQEKEVLPRLVKNLLVFQRIPCQTQKILQMIQMILQKRDTPLVDQNSKTSKKEMFKNEDKKMNPPQQKKAKENNEHEEEGDGSDTTVSLDDIAD